MAAARPTSRLWALGAALGLLLAAAVAAEALKTHHHDLLIGTGLFALPAALWAAARVEPAWPLSIGLALSIFSSNWAYVGLHVPFDRVLICFGLLAVAVHAGRAKNRSLLRVEPVHWVLVAAVLVALGSAIWVGTIGQRTAVFQLLDRFGVLPFAAFFVAPLAFRTERQRGILLGTLVVTGAYLGFTAFCEGVHLNALVVPHYILDPNVGIHSDRARGPFVEAVADGMGMYFCGVAALMAARRWREPALRVFAVVVAVLCVIGLIFTLTRAVWLAGAIATVVTLLWMRPLRRFAFPALVGAALVVGLVFAAVPGLYNHASQRTDDQNPVWDRLNSDDAALRMIAAKPLLGFGWGKYIEVNKPFFHQAPNYPLTGFTVEVHNVFLSNAVALGLIGVTIWLAGLFLAVVRPIFRRRGPPELEDWRIGLMAVVTFWFVVGLFGPVAYAFPTLTMWLWGGIVYAGRSRRTAPTGETVEVRRAGQPLLAPAAAILRRA